MRTQLILTAGGLLALLALPACDDSTSTPADSGKEASAMDLAAADRALMEAAVPDTTAPDTAAPDSTPMDQAPADRSPADRPGSDRFLPDSASLDRAPPADSASGDANPCGCKLANDCCWCQALASTSPGNPCAITGCKVSTCEAAKIKKPSVYCHNGKCYLGDSGTTCKTDSDCFLVNNCCNCASLPRTASTPACPISSCFVPTCTSRGLSMARAVCVSGMCRVK